MATIINFEALRLNAIKGATEYLRLFNSPSWWHGQMGMCRARKMITLLSDPHCIDNPEAVLAILLALYDKPEICFSFGRSNELARLIAEQIFIRPSQTGHPFPSTYKIALTIFDPSALDSATGDGKNYFATANATGGHSLFDAKKGMRALIWQSIEEHDFRRQIIDASKIIRKILNDENPQITNFSCLPAKTLQPPAYIALGVERSKRV